MSISEMESSVFMALISRMSGINRWNKSVPTKSENLNDHSFHVGVFCLMIGLRREELEGKSPIDPFKLVVYGMFHDIQETLSEDTNSLFKNYDPEVKELIKKIENRASDIILDTLPASFKDKMQSFIRQDQSSEEIIELVKSADLLQAYSKVLIELRTGNNDFIKAKDAILKQLSYFLEKYEEVDYVFNQFIDSFSLPIDDIMERL